MAYINLIAHFNILPIYKLFLAKLKKCRNYKIILKQILRIQIDILSSMLKIVFIHNNC